MHEIEFPTKSIINPHLKPLNLWYSKGDNMMMNYKASTKPDHVTFHVGPLWTKNFTRIFCFKQKVKKKKKTKAYYLSGVAFIVSFLWWVACGRRGDMGSVLSNFCCLITVFPCLDFPGEFPYLGKFLELQRFILWPFFQASCLLLSSLCYVR